MTGSRARPKAADDAEKRRLDEALEEGLEETFPGPIPSMSPSRRPQKATTTSAARIERGWNLAAHAPPLE
jgi:hypothetical protein